MTRLSGLGETPGFRPALLGRVIGLLTVLAVIAPPEPAPTSMTAAFEAQGGRGGGRRSADRPPRSGGGRIRLCTASRLWERGQALSVRPQSQSSEPDSVQRRLT